ncbi:MAG: hypothetical protein AAFP85_18425 [Pseudomonadota bacterium]
MAKRATKKDADPVDVRIVGLSDDILATLTGLQDRIAALEARDTELREKIAALEAKQQAQPRGGPFGAGGPVLPPTSQNDPDVQVTDAGELASKLADDIVNAHPEDSPFSLDGVEIDLAGAVGHGEDGVVLGTNPRRAVTGDTATRIKFNLRRRTRTTIVK